MQYWVQIAFHQSVQSLVENIKPHWSVFLFFKDKGFFPFSLCWFNNVPFEHFVDFKYFELSCLWIRTVPRRVDGLDVVSKEFDMDSLRGLWLTSHFIWCLDRMFKTLSRFCEYLAENLTFPCPFCTFCEEASFRAVCRKIWKSSESAAFQCSDHASARWKALGMNLSPVALNLKWGLASAVLIGVASGSFVSMVGIILRCSAVWTILMCIGIRSSRMKKLVSSM